MENLLENLKGASIGSTKLDDQIRFMEIISKAVPSPLTMSVVDSLKELKGKVIFMNLWATWCPPCVAEMPSLQKLYDKYGDQLAFYFVSNEKPATINRFLDSKNYTFPVYIPGSNYPKEFDSNSLPTTYVLDQEGKIIMEEVGAHDWYSNSFVEKIDGMLR
jgi:thiol-disulfide isomerase/thioredoxin